MGVLFKSKSGHVPDYYKQKTEAEAKEGRKLSNDEFERDYLVTGGGSSLSDTGTSVFDPCLCELDYSWFTKEGDTILDPFAGGSVRGVVASMMGRKYTGIELRAEQVEANVRQGGKICTSDKPKWLCGDSLDMDSLVGDRMFDHVFTCPPYGDLEVYSDDARDISNMPAEQFDEAYRRIIALAASHLKDDRFATVVVGNYRDAKGNLRDLCGITIQAAEQAGLRYYNDLIIVTPAGSLPIRVGRQFAKSRKIGRQHQYVLNFVKGDAKEAAGRLGDVVLPDMEEIE